MWDLAYFQLPKIPALSNLSEASKDLDAGRFKIMRAFARAADVLRPRLSKRMSIFLLLLGLLLANLPQELSAYPSKATQAPPDAAPAQVAPGPPYAQQTPEQLQQLVAPIALYPDSLVAQILAASTFPEQVVEADRWVQEHPDLKDQALAQAVDQQRWDPSVKALTAFASVLGNMDKNLSWTSSLGDAYYNQQQDVMDAIQVMRQKAQQAGNLKTTPQQVVTNDGSAIDVAPANPEIVYVPAYDPWLVYGYPVAAWPGWYPYPGIWYEGPYLSFGVGFGIGFFGGFGWGYPHWGFDWHNHYALYNHDRYYSHSVTFYNRNTFYRGGGVAGGVRPGAPRGPGGEVAGRGQAFNRPGGTARPFEGSTPAARGYAAPSGERGTRAGAFSNYDHGGETRSYSSRGSSSFGGGPRGGGGGGARGGGGGRR
jgi:uncharacterized membrane protein YgcG